MPIYTAVLTIPANTPKDDPRKTQVELKRAVLTEISIRIPAGHHALTGIRILYGDLQLFPEEVGTWLQGDDEVIDWQEYFELPDDPTRLRIEGYNEDDTYEHSFYLRFATLPKRVAAPWLAIARFVKLFSRLVGLR